MLLFEFRKGGFRPPKPPLWVRHWQHRLLVAEVDERKLNNVVKKESRVKCMVWKFKKREMQEKFKRKVEELVDVETTNLREFFRDGILTACDELCGKK